jgi:hypothetical protein
MSASTNGGICGKPEQKINLIRDYVEKSKNLSQRPHFSKDIKDSVAALQQSGIAAADLARMTGLSLSSLSPWCSKTTAFHKVTKEMRSNIISKSDFDFKLTLPNGSALESSSELVL